MIRFPIFSCCKLPLGLAAALLFGPLIVPTLGADDFSGRAVGLEAEELADFVGVRWWQFEVEFPRPVARRWVKLVEAERQPDGSWQVRELDQGAGWATVGRESSIVKVGFLATDENRGIRFRYRVDNAVRSTRTLRSSPFDRYQVTTSGGSGFQVVAENVVVLAVEYQNPSLLLEGEEVRVLGLQVTGTDFP